MAVSYAKAKAEVEQLVAKFSRLSARDCVKIRILWHNGGQ